MTHTTRRHTGGEGVTTRLAYGPNEAAALLGISRDTFDREVLPELRVARLGRRIVVSRAELERWLDRSSALHS